MAERTPEEEQHTPLPDPEYSAAEDPREGVSGHKVLGLPVWALAGITAAAAAVMYALMLFL